MNNINILDPNWVTGFVDAEGCFTTTLRNDKNYKTGWAIVPAFKIKLHKKDKELLNKIKSYFKEAGTIWNNNRAVYYTVCDKNEIMKVIIPHFEKYPLITQKQADFILFKNIMELVNKGKHLDINFLEEIINIKASLNKGLSDKVKLYFPNITAIDRPKVALPLKIDYNWFAGFFSGEGCFFIGISKTNSVNLRIFVGQHSRDKLLINRFIDLLDCGSVKYSNDYITYSVNNFKNIYNIIIPFFSLYRIEGVKLLDFQDFCRVGAIINKKAHLTEKGLKLIKTIKSKMNNNRV